MYGDTFGGAVETSCSVLDVYAVTTAPDYQKMVQAIQAASQGYPYQLIGVANSYSQLEADVARLAASQSRLANAGYTFEVVYPDVASNKVDAVITPRVGTHPSAMETREAEHVLRRVAGPALGSITRTSKPLTIAPAIGHAHVRG
jgi:hypothetical protein